MQLKFFWTSFKSHRKRTPGFGKSGKLRMASMTFFTLSPFDILTQLQQTMKGANSDFKKTKLVII